MTERARSVLLTLLLVVSTLSTVGVGAASAAAANSSPGTFHVTQAGQCITVSPMGDGSQSVEEFYDYRSNETDPTGKFSSYGTDELQKNQVSNLFLYHGTEGISIVFLHDKLDTNADHASTITFVLDNVSGTSWAVQDDTYANDTQDDDWQTSGSTNTVDWKWASGRTDGGALRGFGDAAVTVTPMFNEEARDWESWPYNTSDDKMKEWRLLGESGSTVTSLNMDQKVTVEKGSCPDTTAPSAALSASPTTVANNEAVTFDASGSSDDGSGIAEYRWDFDGDDEVDRNTTDATVNHTYESTDTYEASVTVVDAAGNKGTATATVKVESTDAGGPTVDVSAPETVNVSETFEVSADASNESKVESYEWDFNGTTKTGSTVSHNYTEAGNHTVTLTWTDTDGETHNETVEIEAVKPDDGDTAPTVENFRIGNPANTTVGVSFTGSASITNITVNVTDANGTVVATLNESDFDASDAGDSRNYTATTTVESAGTYTAELVTAADADGDDAADGQTDSIYVGTVEGEINYVNATHVWVNGTFERVDATVGFYGESGYGQSMIRKTNVSGSTLISSEGMGGVNGTVINLVEADVDNATAGDSLAKENPNLSQYAERIEPRPVTASVENVTEVDGGVYEVTFGYANPNNESLTMPNSTLSGNVSGSAPETFQSGEHNFTVTWTPDTDDERAAWTLNRSAFGQSDATARTKTAAEYGGTGPEIEFVNESAVRVTGDFAAVNLTTVSFTADGKQTTTHTFENVSNETLLTPSVDATWGPVTKDAAAFENASDAEPALSATNPDFDSQLAEVRPEKVSTFVADANETGNGTYEVTFGYVNPNDRALNASASAFTAGNTSDQPPATFAPGRHTFTVNWTADSNESNLVWETDLSNFGYGLSTATSPTPKQIEAGEMPPTARLSADSDAVTVGDTVTFDASASTDDENVTKYEWDFDGDGEIDRTTNETATVEHTYESPGTYEVSVTVFDESGQADFATETVVVSERDADDPPTARLTGPDKGPMSLLLFQMNASASTDDEGIAKYHWDFNGDGKIDRTADAKVSFKPYNHVEEPGTYEVIVTVEDTSGQNDTASVTYTAYKVTPTADVTASAQTVEVGEEVTFTAKNPNQKFENLRKFHWRTGDRTSPERTATWTTSFDEPGEHTVELVLQTRYGVQNTVETTIEVKADDGSGGDHDHGNDHDNDNNDRDFNDGDGDNTDSRSDGIGAADPGNNNNGDSSDDTETVSAPMRDADSRVGEVVVSASGSNADPAVDVTDSAPADVTAPTVAEDGFAALSYLNVSGADRATFTVSKSRLQASDASADAVSLFRYDGSAWSIVETAQVNETGDAYEFRANVSDGVYAVGIGEAVTSVADVSVDSQRVEPGQQVTVTAAIENTGHAEGTREVQLTVGGEVVATKTVSVSADGTTEVTFTRTFDESGVYSVGVGDASAEVVVKGIETQTTTADGSDSSSTTTADNSSSIPGFGVGASLVALVAAALIALRRR